MERMLCAEGSTKLEEGNTVKHDLLNKRRIKCVTLFDSKSKETAGMKTCWRNAAGQPQMSHTGCQKIVLSCDARQKKALGLGLATRCRPRPLRPPSLFVVLSLWKAQQILSAFAEV